MKKEKFNFDFDMFRSLVSDIRIGDLARIKFHEETSRIIDSLKSAIVEEFNLSKNEIRLVVANVSVGRIPSQFENVKPHLHFDLLFEWRDADVDDVPKLRKAVLEKMKRTIKCLLENVFGEIFDVKVQFC